MWLPAPGTGGPVSPALGTAAFCCPLVRSGSWAPFGVPMAPTPPFWGPSGRGTAFGVPRAGHASAGPWHFMLGAAVPGWLLHVPLRDESLALKLIDPQSSCACLPLPTASWDPTLSPRHALGCGVLSPRCQPRPPLSFGTCSLPSGEETFTLTSARAAVAACK